MAHDLIVGVDTSETSKRAVIHACGLSADGGLSVLLCHVIPWSPFSFTTPDENERRAARKQMELDATYEQVLIPMQKLAAERGVTVDVVARHGEPSDTLIELAEQEQAAQVIVGRTGDSAIRSRIFGTLASHLVQECTVPVTVVP